MSKEVFIIGTGMGPGTLTDEARAAIEGAAVLLGAPRMLQPYANAGKGLVAEYAPAAVAAAVEAGGAGRYAVLVSGDVGFYSAARSLLEGLRAYDPVLLPGVSSLSYLCAKAGQPWQGVHAVSLHGKDADIVSAVRRHERVFCLTGNNTEAIAARLVEYGWGELSAIVGQDLGGANERVYTAKIHELAGPFSPLTVLLIHNSAFDDRVRTGLRDDAFMRGGVPMTKAEVRAVTMSKLAVSPRDVCYDVGCGTGSVTVEMALSAYDGHVYAFDKDGEAIELTRYNALAFRAGNVTAIEGGAPECFAGLPAPDAAFIGGGGARTGAIIAALLEQNPRVRIAVNAILLETVQSAIAALQEAGIKPQLAQIGVARGRQIGGSTMLEALNPVSVIWGGGDG